MEPKIGLIGYYNVRFYLILKSEEDHVKFNYLANRIDSGEAIMMRSIYAWCDNQGIIYKTKFMYRKDFSLKANLWNLYSYMRGKLER